MSKISLGANIPALRVQRDFALTAHDLSAVYERLSSGQRINGAADDPAGLAIAEALLSDAKVFGQALRNLNDGVSLLNIQDSALDALTEIVVRQEELAQQAANETYTFAQRQSLQAESDALVDEFNRIVETTEFNGIKVLESRFSNFSLQAGRGAAGRIEFDLAEEFMRNVGDGTFAVTNSFASGSRPLEMLSEDLNHDGKLDAVVLNLNSGIDVLIGNGDGTFNAKVVYGTGGAALDLVLDDFNNDGNLDVADINSLDLSITIRLGTGTGTFGAQISISDGSSAISAGDFNGDGFADIAAADGIFISNGDGTFKTRAAISATNFNYMHAVDLNRDGILDLVGVSAAALGALLGNGDGTFGAMMAQSVGGTPTQINLGDFDRDGYLDAAIAISTTNSVEIKLGHGDGTFATGLTFAIFAAAVIPEIADFTGDGILDVMGLQATASILLVGNGDGTLAAGVSAATGGTALTAIAAGDFNSDGAMDFVYADDFPNKVWGMLANRKEVGTMAYLDLFTADSAQDALSALDETLERVAAERGAAGSQLSRLSFALDNASAFYENSSAAAQRILDVDVAEETANLVRLQVLQQAQTALLAQANQNYGLVMSLIEGK